MSATVFEDINLFSTCVRDSPVDQACVWSEDKLQEESALPAVHHVGAQD